ncbi:Ca-activated chloride channel family protein [Methylobacter tundripaludum]|uniref:Ca-activated chloride channel family protein n=1 Tax=Methylobacter tundripaludum TaxID=173365 RepID=A0A2S6HLJ2_9GAMM|nr:VWA domain-containing protein [Methylobacter tundripaludum]PPK78287.1 Ca-activated chloride channel family protein [Methylobacter tundripaludum]
MIHFEWPWLLAALPIPLLIRWLVPAKMPVEQAALKVPFLDDFSDAETRAVSQTQQWPLLLAAIAWLFLVIACTRPQWLGEPIEQAVSGRDLMLAVDLSGSMEEQDFVINKRSVDRLTAAKMVAADFINRRVGDRVGLILFGTQAYLQTPLTFDRKTVMTLLNESVIGLAGDNTAIGDAIGLAVKRLKNEQANSRVLVLMTDGANTAGEVSPLKAAELAAANHLKIYTIGIGADEMIVRSFFGNRKVNPSVDLDEKTLIKIAESTGGQYYRARNTDELNNIYMRLDELEPVEKDKQYFRPRSELYYWPLSLALGLAAVIALSRVRLS